MHGIGTYRTNYSVISIHNTVLSLFPHYHCSFNITVPLLSLLLYYHYSFTITVTLPSLFFHCHCSSTITVPLQGGVLISSNSLTGLSSNSTTATVEDLPTADYHVFQVGIHIVLLQ